ncbi:hypothetical protein [Phascolarctobacterium succinatutens]|uniref:hypothetical protein n=1 Tax=Phascolarctobacterium succinatutens TaxID=626940 RepID=UPI003078B9D5
MMKKNSTKGYVILGILFTLVSIIAFAVPTLKTATFWIAYVFTAAAFAAQIIIWRTALGKEALKSKFLGFPVVHIGIVYAIIQTVAFAVFLFAPMLPVWSAIVVCSIIAGVSAVCMISTDAGLNEIERVEAEVQEKVFFIRELQADIELIATTETDADTKAELTRLAEKISFSDPMSNEQLMDLENKISTKVLKLKTATNKVEIITELTLLLDERNKKCKILK